MVYDNNNNNNYELRFNYEDSVPNTRFECRHQHGNDDENHDNDDENHDNDDENSVTLPNDS